MMPGIKSRRHSWLYLVVFASALAGGPATIFAQTPDPVAKGIEEFHRGQYQASQANLEQALKTKPGDPYARTFFALAQAATGGCGTATNALAEAFAKNSDADLRRLAGLALAQCHLSRGRLDEALPVVLTLEKEFPADPDVLYEAAKVHMRAWNDIVYRLFQNAPASYRVNQISAEIFEIQARYAEAVAEYRKALAKNPTALNLHFRLGRALLLESHAPQM